MSETRPRPRGSAGARPAKAPIVLPPLPAAAWALLALVAAGVLVLALRR